MSRPSATSTAVREQVRRSRRRSGPCPDQPRVRYAYSAQHTHTLTVALTEVILSANIGVIWVLVSRDMCGQHPGRDGGGRRMRRLLVFPRFRYVACLASVVALVLPSIALGTTYWGFNYMTASSPSGACSLAPGLSGIACSSTASVSNQREINSGSGCIRIGWISGSSISQCGSGTITMSAYDSLGYSPAGGEYCQYSGGGSYAYVQCRYFNGF